LTETKAPITRMNIINWEYFLFIIYHYCLVKINKLRFKLQMQLFAEYKVKVKKIKAADK